MENDSSAYADGSGNYTIRKLPAGTYRVRFLSEYNYYMSEYYGDTNDLNSATHIILAAETTISGIDASLAIRSATLRTSTISGRVTGPDGSTPLPGIIVSASIWDGSYWHESSDDRTDSNGNYSIESLGTGSYRVEFDGGAYGYATEFYNTSSNQNSVTEIAIQNGMMITGIDASLTRESKISGRVTGSDGTTPVDDGTVFTYRWTGSQWELVWITGTDIDGTYQIWNLRAGTYRLKFQDDSENYASEYYNNATNLSSATDIVLAAETTVTGIDASLANASRISGKVTVASGATLTPLESSTPVNAYRWTGESWSLESRADTDNYGNYSIAGLAAGVYRVEFEGDGYYYTGEYYNNALTLDSSTAIMVPAATTVS
ncbi:MAG: hypothetical protein HC845_14080, partial [Akkermansiaceae bacterium]|nr:hypothetical protein [Akkermansiaceae bacterium]